jgi:predicted anti-sigma-YlaC factor YlaD
MELAHLTDEALELYILKHSLSEEETNTIEAHLVSCEWCRGRCEDVESEVDLLRATLKRKAQGNETRRSLFLVVGSQMPRREPN